MLQTPTDTLERTSSDNEPTKAAIGDPAIFYFPPQSLGGSAIEQLIASKRIRCCGETGCCRLRFTRTAGIGMYLLGQALFSKEFMLAFNYRSVRTVAVCGRDGEVLRPLAEKYSIEIICYA